MCWGMGLNLLESPTAVENGAEGIRGSGADADRID
jgi:hypothetical protein